MARRLTRDAQIWKYGNLASRVGPARSTRLSGYAKDILRTYREAKVDRGGALAARKFVKGIGHFNLTGAARKAAMRAPGGPSNTGKSTTMVRAHLKQGRPVKQHVRHLGANAKAILSEYRRIKSRAASAVSVGGHSPFFATAKEVTSSAAGYARRNIRGRYANLFNRRRERNR